MGSVDSTFRIGSFYGYNSSTDGDYKLHSTGIEADYMRSAEGLNHLLSGGIRINVTKYNGEYAGESVDGAEIGASLLTGKEFTLGEGVTLTPILGFGLVMGSLDVDAEETSPCHGFDALLKYPEETTRILRCHFKAMNGTYVAKPVTLDVSLRLGDYSLGLWSKYMSLEPDEKQTLPVDLLTFGAKLGFAF